MSEAIITVERARIHLGAWLDAELKVTNGQNYSIGSRSLTYANISEIRKQIEYWRNQVAGLELQASGRKVTRARRFIPRDL
ncbi:DUF6148 family protein [Psychrobacillus sp.]|uniref:DUF6148 family protein n=1 Tax=Psychrobacillus sp. TaxID=1871623 RepID=UPI0028BE9044|nr:DUF6148 family protein [Psychrobacillus sp.]